MLTQAKSSLETAAVNEAQQAASSAFVSELETQVQAGNLKTALVLGAVGGVVAGIAYGGLKWHQHKEKEHMRQVQLVENNHTKNLTGIKVSNTEEIDLPTVFARENGMLHAAKDYKTIEEMRKMVNERPSVGFPDKAADAITRTMRKLLEFYEDRLDRAWLWRGSEGDVTSAFLRYQICRLYEYGKKFQGTQYTSAVLNHIHDSINEFSVEHGETSERRTYLDLACRSLKSAVKALDEQKKERTLADLIGEATPDCDELAVKLMHNLTKMVTPTKYWKYIDRTLDPQLLEEGFIKKEVLHGKPGTHAAAIMLHSSPVGQNIRVIAKNYNEAKGLDKPANPTARQTVHQELKTSGFTPEEQQQNMAIFTEQQKHAGLGFARWGQRISNFMTTTSRVKDSKTESGETVPLTEKDKALILDRLEDIHGLAELNNDDILIMKLFFKMQRYAKEQGDEAMANPDNPEVHYMLDVLLSLQASIRKDAKVGEKGLDTVEEDHKLKTLPPEQAFLLTNTKQLVIAIREEIESSIKEIKNYRTETHYEQLEAEVKVHEHETLQLFADVARARGLKLTQALAKPPSTTRHLVQTQPPVATLPNTAVNSSVLSQPQRQPLSQPGPVIPPRPSIRPQLLQPLQPQTLTTGLVVNTIPSTQPVKLQPVPALLGSNAVMTTALTAANLSSVSRRPVSVRPAEAKAKVDIKPEMIDQLLSDIAARIKVIGTEEFKEPYEQIHAILAKLHADYFAMHGDQNSDRRLKAEKTKDLCHDLCQFTLAFLQMSLEVRRLSFQMFAEEIDRKVNAPANKYFVDRHFGRVGKYLDAHKQGWMGMFYTPPDTRKDLDKLSVACHRLGKP